MTELPAKDGAVGTELYPGQNNFQLGGRGNVLRAIELGQPGQAALPPCMFTVF